MGGMQEKRFIPSVASASNERSEWVVNKYNQISHMPLEEA